MYEVGLVPVRCGQVRYVLVRYRKKYKLNSIINHMEKGLIDIHICTRDRPSELTFLLISLRNQTYKNFRVWISDDASGTPIQSYHFLICMINKLNDEGNHVFYSRNDFGLGVSKNRQKLIDLSKEDGRAEFYLRLDDDVIIEPTYISKLLEVINKGYDLASGVTPFIGQSGFKRESKFMNGVVNRVILDLTGNHVMNSDDCGMDYYDEVILPADHFRSCALIKAEVFDKVSYDSRLSKHGFREEQILSYKAIIEGFKIGVITNAKAQHLLTPSGGERFSDSNELVKLNQEIFEEFTRELYKRHGNFIEDYHKRLGLNLPIPSKEELSKLTNLIKI